MQRIDTLDRARAIGMFLVYYGHFVAALAGKPPGNWAATQWELIYSFHVPLFFFLAGIFWKPNPVVVQALAEKLKTRILPVVTFSLLFVPFWLAFMPERFLKLLSLFGYYLQGMPLLDLVTWFLVCLFSVELLAALAVVFFKATPWRLMLVSTIYFLIGYYAFVRGLATVDGWAGLLPRFLHLQDALIMIAFFFAGHLLRDFLMLWDKNRLGWAISVPVLMATGFVVLKTFELNLDAGRGVLVIASIYGNPVWFLLTAFAGIFFVLALSRLLIFDVPYFRFVSQNSLIYLGLNGLDFHFWNDPVARLLSINSQSHLGGFLYASVYVILMMLIYTPVVLALRRWFPQLFGYPWAPTSVLPPIAAWHTHKVGAQRNLLE